MVRKKVKVRKHKRRKLDGTYSLVRDHSRNIKQRARRREKFVKERSIGSKERDLDVTEPYSEFPFRSWDRDTGLEKDLLGVDDNFKKLNLIPTDIIEVSNEEYLDISETYLPLAGAIIDREAIADSTFLDVIIDNDILRDKLYDRNVNVHELIRALQPKITDKIFQEKIDYVKKHCYFKSYYLVDDLSINIIQLMYDNNLKTVGGYNFYEISLRDKPNQRTRMDVLDWNIGALEDNYRGFGLGLAMILSQVQSLLNYLPFTEINYIDATAVTAASQKYIGDPAKRLIKQELDKPEGSEFRIEFT